MRRKTIFKKISKKIQIKNNIWSNEAKKTFWLWNKVIGFAEDLKGPSAS